MRLIEIETILLKATDIHDAKIRTARRHFHFTQRGEFLPGFFFLRGIKKVQQSRGVIVVRRRLAKIIKTGPDKFASNERIALLTLKFCIRQRRPARHMKVIRTDLKIREGGFVVLALEQSRHREKVFTARTEGGRISLPKSGIMALVARN